MTKQDSENELKPQVRRQLTLFVPSRVAEEIEAVRRRFNPAQQALIDSHVTLCREDELEPLEPVLANLAMLCAAPISIRFGPVCRFQQGAGLMLPAANNNEPYHQLRAAVLAGTATSLRMPAPHITLMHPRNATCTDEIFALVQRMAFPTEVLFQEICLIEQIDGGPWHVLQRFSLSGA